MILCLYILYSYEWQSYIVALISTEGASDVSIWWGEPGTIPSFCLVALFQLTDYEENQVDSGSCEEDSGSLLGGSCKKYDGNEESSDQGDGDWDDPALKTILLSVSTGEDDSFSSFRIFPSHGNIMDDIVNDTWTASDVDNLNNMIHTKDPTNQKTQWFQRNCIRV